MASKKEWKRRCKECEDTLECSETDVGLLKVEAEHGAFVVKEGATVDLHDRVGFVFNHGTVNVHEGATVGNLENDPAKGVIKFLADVHLPGDVIDGGKGIDVAGLHKSLESMTDLALERQKKIQELQDRINLADAQLTKANERIKRLEDDVWTNAKVAELESKLALAEAALSKSDAALADMTELLALKDANIAALADTSNEKLLEDEKEARRGLEIKLDEAIAERNRLRVEADADVQREYIKKLEETIVQLRGSRREAWTEPPTGVVEAEAYNVEAINDGKCYEPEPRETVPSGNDVWLELEKAAYVPGTGHWEE